MKIKIHGQKGYVRSHVRITESFIKLNTIEDKDLPGQADVCRIEVAMAIPYPIGLYPAIKSSAIGQHLLRISFDLLEDGTHQDTLANEAFRLIKIFQHIDRYSLGSSEFPN